MIHWFHVLLIMLMESFSARRDAQLRFLKCQIEILQQRLPGNRIIIDPTERQRLLTLGKELEHQVQDTLLVVSFKTYKNWLLEERRGKKPKIVGRKRIPVELYDLVVRFAKENATWGLGRILGEVRKLGEELGRSSIQRILKKEGLYPDPYRKVHQVPDSPWRKFIDMHLNTLVACDFLTKEVITPLGKKTAFLLMFIHLDIRR